MAALGLAAATVACGKKGPPLPPLVLLPVPPADFAAVRRDTRVDLTFRIPNANTDQSTPADLARVDVFAWTVPGPVSADEVVQRGTRVATVAVNPPKDPDEPEPETPAPRGPGLEQNEVARVSDTLAPGAAPSSYRAYVAVGFSSRGRRGALSPRIAVPLMPSPPTPAEPSTTYDEKSVTVTWPPVQAGGGDPFTYTVYTPGVPSALTVPPVADPVFVDASPMVWNTERCYEVRAARMVEGVLVEGAASPPRCVTPRDTFAPSAPQGLVGVGASGSISLIWNANPEDDLGGYLVLRAIEPATELSPVTPEPITDTNFRDSVPAGSRVTYAVVAVDRAGNRSQASTPITETAR
jgi:hypothetical protein